jgi:hypothetical protein
MPGGATSKPPESSVRAASESSAPRGAKESAQPFDQSLEDRLERLTALDGRIAELAEDLTKRLDVAQRETKKAFTRNEAVAGLEPAAGAATIRRPRRIRVAPGTLRRFALGIAIVAAAAGAGLLTGHLTADDGGSTEAAPARSDSASADYADRLKGEVEALGAARKAKLDRLRAAETPGKQAAVLETLAERHGRAASRLESLDVPKELRRANDRAATALDRVGEAYRRLAAAAASRDASAYDEQLRAVRRAEASLANRLER